MRGSDVPDSYPTITRGVPGTSVGSNARGDSQPYRGTTVTEVTRGGGVTHRYALLLRFGARLMMLASAKEDPKMVQLVQANRRGGR